MRVLAGLLFTVCLFATTPAYAADRVVVRFSSSADSADRSAARASVDATAAKSLPGLTGVQVVTVPEGDAKSAARTLDNTDGVLWAQPDRRVHAAAMALPSGGASFAGDQWGLLNDGNAILDQDGGTLVPAGVAGVDGNFTNAWETSQGDGVKIAVVDTGVDFTIPDLQINQDPDPADGYDFVDKDTDPSPEAAPDPSHDETSHGTHVAGIAAAAMGVSQPWGDIVGGAPKATIMSVRALDQNGSGWDSDIAAAFSFAADHGARVVNASLGGPGESDAMHQAIASHPDTLFVVAAGNDGQDAGGDYPCADPDPNIVCVAAVDNAGRLASFSNYGQVTVDVAAPGVSILSYVHGRQQLEFWDGTSMATPYVSAAAALAFARHTEATPSQVRASILATAKSLPQLCGRVGTSGMIDAAALVDLATAQPAPHPCGAMRLSTAAPVAGRALTAAGTFDRGTVAWQWQRCTTSCASIAGATRYAYTPQAADIGKRLRAVAIASVTGHSTAAYTAMSAAVAAAPVAPKPTPTPTPTPAPIAKPATPASPKLSLYKPHRRTGKLAISGRVARTFHGTVTLKVCVGKRCRTVRVKAHSGSYSANVRPARRGRVVITASVRAGAGFTAARAKRTVRF